MGRVLAHRIRVNRNKINNKVMGQNRNRLVKAKTIDTDLEIDPRMIEKNQITKKHIKVGKVVEEDTHAAVLMNAVIKIAIMIIKVVDQALTITNTKNITKIVVKLTKILKKAYTKIEAAKFVPKIANRKREKTLATANNLLARKRHQNKRLILTKLLLEPLFYLPVTMTNLALANRQLIVKRILLVTMTAVHLWIQILKKIVAKSLIPSSFLTMN
jgi:hypothetical protein